MLANRSIQYRIYPDADQEQLIQKTFGCVRFIWNQELSDEEEFYAATGKCFIPTPACYKKEYPFLKEVDSLALANAQLNLKRDFQAFFKDSKTHGYPKFKSKKKSKKSYTTNCLYGKSQPTIRLEKNGIRLPKLGVVQAKLHRLPKSGWKLKSATISQTKSGKYFCSVLFECEIAAPAEVLPTDENTIGLDYSSPKFYVDNNGHSPEKDRWFRKVKEKLAHEQRLLSHMQYGSKNYLKQAKKVARIHEHIANQRKDFAHKESRRIANAYGAVCVEDLDLRTLSRTLKLGKSTMDNGFGMFRIFLSYKLAEQGKHLIKIDKWFPSSKTCCFCGKKNKNLKLEEREWICPHCGQLVPRDEGAGKNLKREGIAQFYRERAAAKSAS